MSQFSLEGKNKKNSIYKILLILFGLGLLALGYLAYTAWSFINTQASIESKQVLVKVEEGATLSSISKMLYEEGLISDADKFQIYVQAQNKASDLKAGTFMLNTSSTPEKILEDIVEGNVLLQRLIIREGLAWWTIAELLEEEGFCKKEDFIKVIYDPAFLKKHNIPFENAEGFLYPETYFMPVPQGMDEGEALFVATTLVEMFWEQSDSLWKEAGITIPEDSDKLEEIIILASIVERETRVKDERSRVAGVYANRIDINMRLQADPTVIYGVGPEYPGSIFRSHLNDESNTYNTYQHNGLPPGPICSPSLDALTAATYPEEHSYLYFVATGIGITHTFSTNLNDHNKAVREYRKNLNR